MIFLINRNQAEAGNQQVMKMTQALQKVLHPKVRKQMAFAALQYNHKILAK